MGLITKTARNGPPSAERIQEKLVATRPAATRRLFELDKNTS